MITRASSGCSLAIAPIAISSGNVLSGGGHQSNRPEITMVGISVRLFNRYIGQTRSISRDDANESVRLRSSIHVPGQLIRPVNRLELEIVPPGAAVGAIGVAVSRRIIAGPCYERIGRVYVRVRVCYWQGRYTRNNGSYRTPSPRSLPNGSYGVHATTPPSSRRCFTGLRICATQSRAA